MMKRICLMLFLGLLMILTPACATSPEAMGTAGYGKALTKNLDKLVEKQIKAYHWKLVDSSYSQISCTVTDNTVEVVWLVELKHRLNYDRPEAVPVLKGKIRCFNDSKDSLNPSEMLRAQQDIEAWKNSLEKYISKDQAITQYIKTTATLDSQQRIKFESVREYIQNGDTYIAAEDFLNLPDAAEQENMAYEQFLKEVIGRS